jgi:TolA-binding protein
MPSSKRSFSLSSNCEQEPPNKLSRLTVVQKHAASEDLEDFAGRVESLEKKLRDKDTHIKELEFQALQMGQSKQNLQQDRGVLYKEFWDHARHRSKSSISTQATIRVLIRIP